MDNETPAQLVARLSHPNGWWRDTAQRLLVLKQNMAVVPALKAMLNPSARPTNPPSRPATQEVASASLLARFHALWTLEGLGALDAALVRQQLNDPEPRMRIQAIRASETLYKKGDRSFADDYQRLARDPSVDVVIQAILTMNRWKVPDAGTIQSAVDTNTARGVQLVGRTVMNAATAALTGAGRGGRGGAPLTAEQQTLLERGGAIYNELCFACHGSDGFGTPKPELATTMAPPLAGSPRVNGHRDYIVKAVMHGLTGPVDNKTYTDVMIPNGMNNDEWIAAVASYVRTSFGNRGSFVTPADVARVRVATSARAAPWTVSELTASLPALLFIDGWKTSASHNGDSARDGLTLTAWSSGAPQQAGMWFQIELPKPRTIAEIQFQSPAAAIRGAAVASGGSPTATPEGPGYPRGYRVEVSLDGTSWKSVVEGAASGPSSTIALPSVEARFVKITLTTSVEANGPRWSIQALKIYALTETRN